MGDERASAKFTIPVFIVGPCALEYTKLKTADHYWTDPSADELVQRHRIRGPPNRQDSPAKRPALGVSVLPTSCAHLFRLLLIREHREESARGGHGTWKPEDPPLPSPVSQGSGLSHNFSWQIRKRHSSGSASEDRLAACAREYVESLHQNSRTRLLYGKNNVLVQPVGMLCSTNLPSLLSIEGPKPEAFSQLLCYRTLPERREYHPTHTSLSYDSCPAWSWQETGMTSALAS